MMHGPFAVCAIVALSSGGSPTVWGQARECAVIVSIVALSSGGKRTPAVIVIVALSSGGKRASAQYL